MEACQVQRGEGTISHLCLGGWGVGLAGDMAAAAEGGRGWPFHLCGLMAVCPALCLRECGLTLGPWAPLGQLRHCACGVLVFILFVLQSQRGRSISAFVPLHSSSQRRSSLRLLVDLWAVGLDPYGAGTAGTSSTSTVTST